jgi:hypothetical protein
MIIPGQIEFVVMPEHREDPKDELARELTMTLINCSLVSWKYREECRTMLRLALLGKSL